MKDIEMDKCDDFKTLMFSEYSKRRHHLARIITVWDQVVISGSVFMMYHIIDEVYKEPVNLNKIAWLTAVAAILVCLWRSYVHRTDCGIFKLYPVMYYYERMVVPKELSTIRTPNKNEKFFELAQDDFDNIQYIKVKRKDGESGGHNFIDIGALIFILVNISIPICLGLKQGVLSLSDCISLHAIACPILVSIIFLVMSVILRCHFRNAEFYWPIPDKEK